jgi:hypothetical protein
MLHRKYAPGKYLTFIIADVHAKKQIRLKTLTISKNMDAKSSAEIELIQKIQPM